MILSKSHFIFVYLSKEVILISKHKHDLEKNEKGVHENHILSQKMNTD